MSYKNDQTFVSIRLVRIVANDRGIYLTEEKAAMHLAIILEDLEEQKMNDDIESIDDEFFSACKEYFNN